MSRDPDKLIDYAAQHYVHAEAREEGDVAVFTPLAFTDGRAHPVACEIDVVHDMRELRAVLGY